MRYVIATVTVIGGIAGMIAVVVGVVPPMLLAVGRLALWPMERLGITTGSDLETTFFGLVVVGAAVLLGRLICIVADEWFSDAKTPRRIRAVPLSDLVKGMKHDPDRWKEKV